MARILVADDDPSFRDFLRDVLASAGHDAVPARDGQEALLLAQREPFDLVLSDQRMPRVDGLTLVTRLRASGVSAPVVVLTAFGTIPDAVEAVRLGAADYLTKPLPSPEALLGVVRRLLSRGAGDDELVTGYRPLLDLLELVDRVAPRDVPVLVTGESGTGKELIARRLHRRSPRAAGPFVAVNAAALPESLAESELFGHERGAFTGADRARAGRFEEAGKGTLFLDEVGELPPSLQSKLLRTLEERTVRRLGGSRDVAVDVRLVAATNRDLPAEVDRGAFRRDLYFRLAVVPVALPPLRERTGDVPLLAAHLLGALSGRHAVGRSPLTPEALEALERHPWPGNVRELRNVLERALLLRAGLPIRPEDLGILEARPSAASPARESAPLPLDQETRDRGAIVEALRQADGNREAAARLLGVSVRTLYYRLRRFGLS